MLHPPFLLLLPGMTGITVLYDNSGILWDLQPKLRNMPDYDKNRIEKKEKGWYYDSVDFLEGELKKQYY